MEHLGAQIKHARLAAGVSQASLARRAGTSQAAISRIERGLEQPGPERAETIFASLGLRLRITLEPIAEHGVEPGALIEEARKTPHERIEVALQRGAAMKASDVD